MDVVILLIRLVLAAVFAAAAVAKLLDLPKAQQTMRDFGVPEPLAQPAGIALPLIELAVALLLLPVATATGGAMLALAVLLGFIGANMAKGNRPDCNCFGQLHSEPVGWRTLARNAVLAALALIAAVSGLAGAPGPSLTAWSGAIGGAGWLALVGVGAMTVATVSVGWLLAHLLSQNGRLLTRIDRIEAALADADIELANEDDEDDDEDVVAERMDNAALPTPTIRLRNIAQPAPAASLPDLDGKTVALEDFRERPTVVLFWRPGCGFCQRMLDELKGWEAIPPADAPQLLIVSSEDVASNRAQGLRSPIVLDQEFSVGGAFGATGTPSAVLIDAEGRIASGVAVGAPAVFGLLRHHVASSAAAVATAEGAEREDDEDDAALPAPAIGTPAPEVKLPDLDGTIVDLAEHRGRPTALIFWDPGCGFCQQMAPALKRWEEQRPPGGPSAVLISEGSVEDNKAQGIRSLVLIDDGFAVGRSYGADGTPMAVLLDAEGRIASELVGGEDDVLALLGTGGPVVE